LHFFTLLLKSNRLISKELLQLKAEFSLAEETLFNYFIDMKEPAIYYLASSLISALVF